MKRLLFLLVGLTAMLAGCSTVATRIGEKSAFFNSLDPQTQERLKQGVIRIGDQPDMVYIAFGQPDRIIQKSTAKGQETTWIYTERWQEYQGSQFVGFERHAYVDRGDRTRRVYYEPVRADFYRDREEEYLRVAFKDGKVAAIDQTKQ